MQNFYEHLFYGTPPVAVSAIKQTYANCMESTSKYAGKMKKYILKCLLNFLVAHAHITVSEKIWRCIVMDSFDTIILLPIVK